MKIKSLFVSEAIESGYPPGLVMDFLDALDTDPIYAEWANDPTLARLEEYKADADSLYFSQVRWDASCRQEVILPRP